MRTKLLSGLAIATLLGLAGCAGNGAGASSVKSSRTSGTVRLSVKWPTRATRLIPLATERIEVRFLKDGDLVQTESLSRPTVGDSTTKNIEIAAGYYTVKATALAPTEAASAPLATGESEVGVQPKENSAVDISMDSTIAEVRLSPNPANLRQGRSSTIVATALDAKGAMVLVDPTKWDWTITDPTLPSSQPVGASLSVKPQTVGTSTVTVKETESDKSATLSVNVVETPTVTLNAWGGYGGSLGFTHYMNTSPAAGVQGFKTTMPSYYVATDKDGNVFSTRQTALTSYTPTGAERWTVTVADPSKEAFRVPMVLSDGTVVVNGQDANGAFLRAFNGNDGTVKWNRSWAGGTARTHSVCLTPDGYVVIGLLVGNGFGNMIAVDPVDGSTVWSRGGGMTEPAAFSCGEDGTLAVYNGRSVLDIMDSATGVSRGAQSSSGFAGGVPVVANGTVYMTGILTGNNSVLMALDGSGNLRWTTPASRSFQPSATPTGDVYAQALDGGLMKVSKADGSVLWKYPVFNLSTVSPVIDGSGNVYFVANNGISYRLISLTSEGALRWDIAYTPDMSDGNTIALGPNGTLYLPGPKLTQIR